MSVFSVLGSLTAKCGSKSMRSVSLKPEIFSALGRWSTTACSGTPLPRPLEPLPRALTAPRPRGWTPRPRPGDSNPRLAAWKKTIRAHQNTAGVEIMFHHLKFQEQVCPQVATVQAAFLYMVSSLPSFFFFFKFNTSICSWVYLIFNRAVSSPAWVFLYRSSCASSSSFCACEWKQI